MPLRLILLVLDGFSLRHCTREIAPNLVGRKQGVHAPTGGRSVLPSSTYPNHASLATGAEPIDHGIYANNTFTDAGIRPARDIGARGVTFLDAARAAGLRTAVSVGDANILGVVGASRCDVLYPVACYRPELVRGYAANAAPFFAGTCSATLPTSYCAFSTTQTASHTDGPDSTETKRAYTRGRRARRAACRSAARRARWNDTIVAVMAIMARSPRSFAPADRCSAPSRAGIRPR
jgi:hypothetical protein